MRDTKRKGEGKSTEGDIIDRERSKWCGILADKEAHGVVSGTCNYQPVK